jgi:tetratricopeptide (TPR) repeat protein
MARSSEKAKTRVSRAKPLASKRRSKPKSAKSSPGGVARKASKARASQTSKDAAGTPAAAKGKKRTEGSTKGKKPARTPAAAKKPAEAKKAAAKAPKARRPAKAAKGSKPNVLKKPQASPQPVSAPPGQRRKPVMVRSAPPPAPPPVDKHAEQAAKAERQLEQRQTEYYEKAVAYFNARKFSRALPLMEKAAEGPNVTLRHRARVYADICRQQVHSEKVELKTADDHYNYGVKLMNDRRLEEAERHLQRALRLAPKAGYLHYANAVLSALQGNAESAFVNLKRAIEIDPLNRVLARNDADLGSIMSHPPIAQLLREGGES